MGLMLQFQMKTRFYGDEQMAIMKNGYFIFFILALIILTTNTAIAIGTEIISVGSATLDAGSTTTLQVNLANAVDVAGISLDISYDSKMIEITDVSASNDAVSGSVITSNIDNAEGKVKIILTNINLINTINSIPIINIAVHTIGDTGDETTLILQNVDVTDTNFLPAVPKTITNGYVRINGGEKTSFVGQIDAKSKESSVNDELTQSAPVTDKMTQSIPVTDKTTKVENDPADVSTLPSSPSTTDQTSTPGFGFVLTVLTLFLITKINIIK